MKSREEAARKVEDLLKDGPSRTKKAWHFGYCELRELFDFIYEGEPENPKQFINDTYGAK